MSTKPGPPPPPARVGKCAWLSLLGVALVGVASVAYVVVVGTTSMTTTTTMGTVRTMGGGSDAARARVVEIPATPEQMRMVEDVATTTTPPPPPPTTTTTSPTRFVETNSPTYNAALDGYIPPTIAPNPVAATHLSHKCVAYPARYAACLQLHAAPETNRSAVFRQIYEDGLNSTEALIVRIPGKGWKKDVWLNTCALLLETHAKRRMHVGMMVQFYETQFVPKEFEPYLWIQDERKIRFDFPPGIWTGGFHHGDLLAALWLKEKPLVQFVWVTESDVRWIGDYAEFFAYSMEYATAKNDLFVPGDPLEARATYAPRQAPGLILYDQLRTYRYNGGWWPEDKHTTGTLLKRKWEITWLGAGMMMFGFSRAFAMHMLNETQRGNSNKNQEALAPTLAYLDGWKLVQVPVNKEYSCCEISSERIYPKWISGEYPCLTDRLMHPVKRPARARRRLSSSSRASPTSSDE